MLALVLVASAKPAAKLDTRSILAEVEKSQFGSSMMNFVQLNAAGEVPVDEVSTILEEVLDQLQNRQADADSNNATNQAICDETLSNFASQLASERSTIESLENSVETNTQIRDEAKRSLEQAATDYEETVNALESGEAQREGENTKWVDTNYEIEEASVAIEETIKLIKHLIHGVSFAQIKPRYDVVQEKLRKSAKFGTLFKPLILSLSELATKLNYESVVKILDLLNNILGALRQSQTDYRVAEENAAADWESLETHLTDQKQALAGKKSRLNSLITSSDDIISQSQESLGFHREIQAKLEASEMDQETWCEAVSEIYVRETAERSRQSEILETLNDHVSDKWSAVAEYLQTRTV